MINWFEKEIQSLHKYFPPFGNWRFWAIQLLAVPLAALHFAFENTSYFAHLQSLDFIPIALLVVPVVYAAFNFGFAGSIGTAIWVVMLSIPTLVWGPTGLERFGEIFQLGVLVTLAIFLGQRVDREARSRSQLEEANTALSASEKQYRSIFDSSHCAILIMDEDNTIIDANPSAGVLLNKPAEALKGAAANSLGIKCAAKPSDSSLNNNWWETNLVTRLKDSTEVYLEPTCTQVNDIQGNLMTQVLLRDVTEEQQRQAGLKAYTAYMLRAQEEERLHIARELHDETIQTLALLCRQLDSIDNVNRNLPPGISEELKAARGIAEKVVTDLRDFTRALRPPILDDLGVVASIRRLMVDFMDRTKVQGQLNITGEQKRLSRDVEVGIFRIAQEALWNIERHAQASRVTITLAFTEQGIQLEIMDNGIGFEVPSVFRASPSGSGLGLVGMQERAELLGGKLELKSGAGKGTTVAAFFPAAKIASENQNSPV